MKTITLRQHHKRCKCGGLLALDGPIDHYVEINYIGRNQITSIDIDRIQTDRDTVIRGCQKRVRSIKKLKDKPIRFVEVIDYIDRVIKDPVYNRIRLHVSEKYKYHSTGCGEHNGANYIYCHKCGYWEFVCNITQLTIISGQTKYFGIKNRQVSW